MNEGRSGPDRTTGAFVVDVLSAQRADGTPFKCLTVVDEFTKECLAIIFGCNNDAERETGTRRNQTRGRLGEEGELRAYCHAAVP